MVVRWDCCTSGLLCFEIVSLWDYCALWSLCFGIGIIALLDCCTSRSLSFMVFALQNRCTLGSLCFRVLALRDRCVSGWMHFGMVVHRDCCTSGYNGYKNGILCLTCEMFSRHNAMVIPRFNIQPCLCHTHSTFTTGIKQEWRNKSLGCVIWYASIDQF